jgi:hypothetical protein
MSSNAELLIFFEAAEALVGGDTRRLPGRPRLIAEYRRRTGSPPGSQDVCSAIVRRLVQAGVLRVTRNCSSELQNERTIGSMLRHLRSPVHAERTRLRKQVLPTRAVIFVDFYNGPKRF